MLNLKIIIGSTRPGRAADRVIPWITALSRQHGAFDAGVIDLRDWDLPMFGENLATVGDPRNPVFSAPVVRRWNDTVAEGDAYLFVTPEYNHILLDDLAWWGTALQQARSSGVLPPAIMRLAAAEGHRR